MHHPFNEDLEVVLQTSEAWDILQGIGGWFDGACLLLACALQRCLGFGQIQVVTRDFPDRCHGSGDHAVLRIDIEGNRLFLDANGLQTQQELIRNFHRDLPVDFDGAVLIEPVDLVAMEENGVFAPENQVANLAAFLKQELGMVDYQRLSLQWM